MIRLFKRFYHLADMTPEVGSHWNSKGSMAASRDAEGNIGFAFGQLYIVQGDLIFKLADG
ncbi:hypothetical protein AO726_00760 [Pseudomonas sp. TTU2014-080ASC]|nr:hypothetical protein AO726_00760 [Pseudomonas sp. TTU2014-080ASC]